MAWLLGPLGWGARHEGRVGRRRGPAAILSLFLHTVAAARCDPRGPRVCARLVILATCGAGLGGRSVGFPALVSAFPNPLSRLPHLAGLLAHPLERVTSWATHPPPAPSMPGSCAQIFLRNFPGSSDGKASACDAGDLGSVPGLRRSPGEGNGNPLQYSCLENPMDGEAW